MIPVIARKTATLSSGKVDVELGFVPDHVEIVNQSKFSSIASASSGDMIKVTGKPNMGSSSGQLMGLQVTGSSNSNMKMVNVGDVVSNYNSDFYGISIDFSSTSGFSSASSLAIVAMRQNA